MMVKSADDDDQDYTVGYGKPPINTRFQKGTSGNPKGRKKDSKNLKADLQEELAERLLVNEGGRQVRLSKQRAMVKRLVVKGLNGDSNAIAKVFDLSLRLIGANEQVDETTPLKDEDQAILDAFFARQREQNND